MANAPVGRKIYRMDVVCTCGGGARAVHYIDGGRERIRYMCSTCFKLFTKKQAKSLNLERKYLTR